MSNDRTLSPFQRNLYFYGKLMTVRDFEMEQSYLNGKRHLINRMVLGTGAVCGLEVTASWDESKKTVTLSVGEGVAIDCGGREVVVDTPSSVTFEPAPDVTAYCLWLSREDCRMEPAPAPMADSGNACGETCCYSRVREDFSLAVQKWDGPVPSVDDAWSGLFTTDTTTGRADIRALLKAHFDRILAGCPACGEPCRVPLALVIRKGGVWSGTPDIIQNIVVHTNPELFEMIRRHLTDLGNPHMTTAAQVGALKSVDGVESPGGNVDLVAANAVQITPNTTARTITIGESHSGVTGNPHNTRHEQTGPACVDPASDDTTCDKHVSNANAMRWNRSLAGLTVNGGSLVVNPGAAIDLAAGQNVTLAADPAGKKITISAAGGGGASARTGRISITTNSDGVGTARVTSGFDDNLFCVQVGIDYGEHVEYGPVLRYAGQTAFVTVRVLRYQDVGSFDIMFSAPGVGQRTLSLRWVAIPAVAAAEPTITVTSPTVTVTSPTFTLTQPTFTLTRPTFTLTQPTFTITAPTLTVPTIPTMTIPSVTIHGPIMSGPGTVEAPTVIVPPGKGTQAPHLTDVKGIGPAMAGKLTAAGISTIADLAAASVDDVATALGGDPKRARGFIDAARKLAKIR